MADWGDSKGGGRHPENAAWYLALILIIVAAFVVWGIFSLRVDLFTEATKRGDTISTLIVIDDGHLPLFTEVLFIHPVTQNAAFVAIPAETGSLLTSVDRVDRLESVYDPWDLSAYKEAVAALLGETIDFEIRLSAGNFEKLVDHLGGIDIFIPNAVDDYVDGLRYLFPPGGVTLDGAKARSYLEHRPGGEVVVDRTEREHHILQSVLRKIGEQQDSLLSDEVFSFVFPLIQSDFDERSLVSFLTAVSMVDTDRIVFQGVLGNRRVLDGQTVLFPYYDGKLIKETVQRINETLVKSENLANELLTIRVEILNGTSVTGLASRTAQIYSSYGFRIAAVSNADNSSYDRTVVLDRRGDPDATRRVAELIRCEQIYSRVEENRDETVDVTIILGKDFDGRYVK